MNETAQAIKNLIASSRLTGKSLTDHFERAIDPKYWACLNPNLSIGAVWDKTRLESLSPEPPYLSDAPRALAHDGYFQCGPTFNTSQIERMRSCVEKLVEEHWPVAFSLIYDDFWTIFRSPSLIGMITSALGPGFRQDKAIWTWHVAKRQGAQGWLPHIDTVEETETLTVWIPLTDATLDNGCIYAVPNSCIPADYEKLDSLTKQQVLRLLQGASALPVSAGSILGWNGKVVHWSSVSKAKGNPRISISTIFTPGGEQTNPTAEIIQSFAESPLPTFRERLRVISRGLVEYRHNEPLLERFQELASLLKVYANTKSETSQDAD